MPNAAKPGLEPLLARLEAALQASVELGEASENTGATLEGPPPALNDRFGEDLQSATPQALRPSGPKRRSSADPGNEASRAGSEPKLAGAPSPAAPEFARAAAAGTSAKLSRLASFSRAAHAEGARLRQGPGTPAGPSRRAKRHRPGRLYWRRRRPRPGRRCRAIRSGSATFVKAPGTAL